MATASTLDHLLTNEEDVASCCVEQLGAVAATMLRAVSRPMHTAFTHTGWAQQFWRLQSVRNPAPEREGAFLGCWFATFAAYHGEACMRPLRRQRRLPCRCGALSCGTTAGCAAASSSTWMWTAPTRGGKSSPKTRGDWGRNIERKPVVRYQAVTSRKGLQAVKSQMNQ